MWVIPASGQTAAEADRSAAVPERSTRLDVRVPQFIAYQGKLTDSTGRPVDDGSYVMVFTLSADSTGSSFWHETQTVETRGGLFNVLLGSNVPIPADAIPQGGCYLGIRVLPSTVEFRRQRIVSVPFAFQADNSDKLQGKDTAALDARYVGEGQANSVTTDMIADTNLTMAKLQRAGAGVGQALAWSDSGWVPSSVNAVNADMVDGHHAGNDSGHVAVSNGIVCRYLNAALLQGKDTSGFVRTGQTDAVTSTMIVNGTVVRADVAAGFKAPFSDTADYARLAPAADSARVAGNSHLLEGKDTTALWNAKTLQGKDTTALDTRYVNEGQTGSITSTMIRDTAVGTVHIRDSAVTAGKIAGGAVASNEIADNSITASDIKDGTITSADIAASGVVAGTYGDGYHVARITVDSVGRLIAASDTTILGAAPSGPAGGDLTGNYPNPAIAKLQGHQVSAASPNDGQVLKWNGSAWTPRSDSTGGAAGGDLTGTYPNPSIAANAVTSAKILDGTIVRADVAANFKAPYSDTADYAGSAPASDSARVAGNAYLLQTKDTTALWNAKTLQGKDTTGFVRTGQADAVTSAMIVNGTIVRADVASSFKAPYSDTADYAYSAPASDSARVAGNSHLLQTKDTTDLWNAKALQGKDTAALWNAKTLQGKDTTAISDAKTLQGKDTTGFVRTNQANSISSAMVVDGTIVRADVATDFKSPYSDTADYAISAPTSDSARVAGNSHLLQGKDTTALWNAKTLQGQDTTALWNAKTLQGQDTAALWNAKTLQGKDTTGFVRTGQADAVSSAMIVPNTIVRADVATDFKAPYADTADYAITAPASDSARVAGNSHLLQGKDTTALWNAKTLQGKDTTALSDAKTLQGKDTTGFVRTNQASSISSAMVVDGTIVRADVATDFKSPYSDTADYAISAPTSDSARVAGNSHLLQGKDTTALWNAKTLQGKDTTGFVRTNQANSISSAMVVDGTIVRADVATDFKSPYSDTADYAYSAPASDSARVAGNSHLLQGKDTTDLWNAKTLQGKDTTALDARYVNESQTAGGDLTGTYPSPTIAANAVTLSKIARGSTSGQAVIAQGSGSDPVWGYPSAVGASGTPVTFVKTDTFGLDLDSIDANSVYQATVYIPGLLTGDHVFLSYPSTGDNWQYIQGLGNCQVTADDSLTFRVWNSSTSSQDPGAATWRYMWIRPQ